MIVSRSSSKKLSSRLILLRSILKILISLQEKMTLPGSSLKYYIFSSAHKTVKRSLIILPVPNQI